MALALLTGGARSGKSRLAVDLASRHDGPVLVIATAEALDDEMVERIRLHRAERSASWTTVEEPIDLEGAITAASPDAFVVIDCLSIWVANLMVRELPDEQVLGRARRAAELAATRQPGTVAVTNEVGSGVVPDNPLGRRYRDVLGRVNAEWAAAADRVGLVVAGRLLPLASAADVWTEDERWTT
jgi:adenosyl cobinamide kinase/adenosyl cobinamide phosphate guanylyltransferase